jgi:hypothetical protein
MDDFDFVPTSHNLTLGLGGGSQLAAMNQGITPYFFLEPIENPRRTAEEGRPIFEDQERVRLFVAGDLYNQVVHPVDHAMRERFPEAYRAFKEKGEMHIDGTPLRQWALLKPSEIAEFHALKIYNVEGLAQIPDSSLQRAHGLSEWREKARAWLATAKDSAAAVKYAEENVRLNNEIVELKRQQAEQGAQIAALNRSQQFANTAPLQQGENRLNPTQPSHSQRK